MFSERFVGNMGGVNDLDLPVLDVSGEIWQSFFGANELTDLKVLVADLQQPMLGMGSIYPLDVSPQLSVALQPVTESEDVSCY